MQIQVFMAEVKRAITEQGVKPENPPRIYKLILEGNSELDFEILAETLADFRRRAKRDGTPIIEEEASNSARKAQAAKNN